MDIFNRCWDRDLLACEKLMFCLHVYCIGLQLVTENKIAFAIMIADRISF